MSAALRHHCFEFFNTIGPIADTAIQLHDNQAIALSVGGSGTPGEFSAMVQQDSARWATVISKVNIKLPD